MLRRYFAKRLLVAVPSLLIATMIVFTLPRLIPGDVVQLMLDEKAYAKDIDELREKLGLSRPIAPNACLRAFHNCSRSFSSAANRTSRARCCRQISATRSRCASSPTSGPSTSITKIDTSCR